MYTLKRLSSQNTHLWDEVLTQCPDTNAFHSGAWRVALENSFNQLVPTYYLIKENNSFIGGLPAFVFQPIPGIKMFHSMPWNLFGGMQLIDEISVEIDSLIESVETQLHETIGEENLCETVFTLSPTQTTTYGQRLTEVGYQKYKTFFTHRLKTSVDYEILWKAYNKRIRGAVRKAAKAGVTVFDTNAEDDLHAFYKIYLSTVKRLGGTPKPLSLIESLYQSHVARLAIAKHDGVIIAGLLYLCFNRTVTLWCEASVPEFLEYRPNNAIFHQIIQWACADGYEWVDFGASPPDQHGLIAHKEQYRAERLNFCNYRKIHSPLKRAVWRKSEPALRQIYTWVQHVRNEKLTRQHCDKHR